MSSTLTSHYRQSPSFAPSERTEYAEKQSESKTKYDDPTSKESKLLSKEKRLDEQFQNLLEKSNRSRELLDNAYHTTFASNRLPSAVTSPKQDFSYTGSVKSPEGGAKFDSSYASNRYQPFKTTDYETNKSMDDYNSRLEHEIQELKNTVIERLRIQEAGGKARESERKKSAKKIQIEPLSSSEDEEKTEKASESFAAKKANPKLHRLAASKATVRSAKSPDSSTLRKRNQKTVVDPEYSDQTPEHRIKRAPNQGASLKHKPNESELALREKYLALKYKAKEMRSTLQEYVDKYVDLEEQLGRKDQILLEYEDQIKQNQHELLRNFELLQETKRSEEAIAKGAEDLRIQNAELKARVQEQKKKLDEMEEQLKRNEEKFQRQIEDLQQEKHDVKVSLRDREDKADHLAYANEKLKNELEELRSELDKREGQMKRSEDHKIKLEESLRELREKVETLQIDNKGLQAKNEDLRENQAYLEDKLIKLKKKTEEERAKWENDKEKEIALRKEKNKQLKTEIKELDALLQRVSDEKKAIVVENEKNATQRVLQEKELNRCREDLAVVQQEMYYPKPVSILSNY